MAGQGAPKTPKQELLEAIEAYGAAKTTDDALLGQLAMVHLARLLRKYDVVAPVPAPQAAAIQAQLPEVPEKPPAKKAPAKKAPAKKAPAKKPAARKPRATKKTD